MKPKICFITAISSSAYSFLRGHIDALSKDYDIFLVSSDVNEDVKKELGLSGYKIVDIHRNVSLINDIKAVFALARYFRHMGFSSSHSVTPKAGLISALAAKISRVPNRIHIFTGQVWATRNGMIRWFLKLMDRIIVRLDNHILVDGKSQREFLVQEGILKPNQGVVLGEGSICGVDTIRFSPDPIIREQNRKDLGISDNRFVYVMMGRMNHDKGVEDLMRAFNKLVGEHPEVYLLLIGSNENGYMESLPVFDKIKEGINYKYYGPTKEPERLLQAGDVFVLPTYREGFGSSVLEASCLGLPVITSDAYGVRDASIEGETGLRFKVGDVEGLYTCMEKLYYDRTLLNILGKRGRSRVEESFSGPLITDLWVDYYHKLPDIV